MNRVALYLGDGRTRTRRSDLRREFQGAKAAGLRVVTVRREVGGGAAAQRPVLKRLVRRMEAGEFEAIVGVTGGDFSVYDLPPPTVGGDTWIVRQGRGRK